MIPVGKEEKAI